MLYFSSGSLKGALWMGASVCAEAVGKHKQRSQTDGRSR